MMATAFDNFDSTVRTYLSKSFANLGLQYTHSQIFGVIFDGMKGIMQNILFYIEDAFTEQNVFTASRKRSIYSLAKISGYEPYYGSAPSGTLTGNLNISNGLDSKTSKIYISNHSKFQNNVTGITYTVELGQNYYTIDITKPLVKHNFKILQGEFRHASYTATGYSLETVHVEMSSLYDQNYLKVKVNGVEYTRAKSLYDMGGATAKNYVLTVGFDNAFDVMFGDDVHGRKLVQGDVVVIDYLKHEGSIGNILPSEASNFVMLTPGYDTFGSSVNVNEYMTFNLETCVSGGTNSDSVDFIRECIGKTPRSGVIATEDNFKMFFKRFSFIGQVTCWADSSSMTVTCTCLRNLYNEITDTETYYNSDPYEWLLTNDQKLMVQNALNNSNKAYAGITLEFQDPIIRRYAAICYVKVNDVYTRDTAESEVKRILADYMMTLDDGTMFIPKSDIITSIINNVKEIVSIDIDFISEAAEQCFGKGFYLKQQLTTRNGKTSYVEKRIMYEPGMSPGLDYMGNISVDAKNEIIALTGGFNYYVDKTSRKNTNNYIKIPAVQVYFV